MTTNALDAMAAVGFVPAAAVRLRTKNLVRLAEAMLGDICRD